MLSGVSLRTFADSATLPVVALLHMQQEHQARAQLFAICAIDSALGNWRKPPLVDDSRRNRKATSRKARNKISTVIVSGVSAQATETALRIAATSPGNKNNGKSADG